MFKTKQKTPVHRKAARTQKNKINKKRHTQITTKKHITTTTLTTSTSTTANLAKTHITSKRNFINYDLSRRSADIGVEPLVKSKQPQQQDNTSAFASTTTQQIPTFSPLAALRTGYNKKMRQFHTQYTDMADQVLATPISDDFYNHVKNRKEQYDSIATRVLNMIFGSNRLQSEGEKKKEDTKKEDGDNKEAKKDDENKKKEDEKKTDDKKPESGSSGKGDKTLEDLSSLFKSLKSKKDGDDDDDDEGDKQEKRLKKLMKVGRIMRLFGFSAMAITLATQVVSRMADTEVNLARKSNSYMQFVQQFLSQNNVKRLTIVNSEVVKVDTLNPPQSVFFDVIDRTDFATRLAIDTQRFNIPSLPINNIFDGSLPDHINQLAHLSINLLFMSMAIGFILTAGLIGGKKRGGGASFMRRLQPQTSLEIKKEENISVRFNDVAGMDEAKEEIVEFVDFLKNPEKYNKLGARLPKGALLSGPPGTGKTLLAKATAGEAGVPFFTVSGSEFQQMYVGVGAKRVRELFRKARKNAPSIIFIDEIDAVAKKRSSKGHGSGEREATLNQLLVEMDGFNTTAPVVVFAATNRVEMLDNALTRAGRFDRKIQMDTPDLKGREHIFKVHLANIKLADDLSLEDVAKKVAALTPGLVGADIANVCNEAAIGAARRGGSSVELLDFDKAVDRVVAGLEKKNDLTKEHQRRIVAYHEAGHAIAGWFLQHTDPLLKVTIVPRTNGALGFAQYLPSETALRQVEHLKDMMAMALGGRAAEHVMFGKVSTGASDDLSRVARIAQQMITRYGMSGSMPNTAFATLNEDHSSWQYISNKTHAQMDDEVRRAIETEFKRVCDLLTNKKDLVLKLGEELLQKETLNHDEIVAVLGPRPVQNDEYVDYIKAKGEFDQQKAKEQKVHDDVKLADDYKKEAEATAAAAVEAAKAEVEAEKAAIENKETPVEEQPKQQQEDKKTEEQPKQQQDKPQEQQQKSDDKDKKDQ